MYNKMSFFFHYSALLVFLYEFRLTTPILKTPAWNLSDPSLLRLIVRQVRLIFWISNNNIFLHCMHMFIHLFFLIIFYNYFFVRLFSIYLGTREQITDITSLIDGGSVYGNTNEQMEKLWDKNTGLATIILLFIILKKKRFLLLLL